MSSPTSDDNSCSSAASALCAVNGNPPGTNVLGAAMVDPSSGWVLTANGLTLRGLVIMALSTPDLASQRLNARPFGAADVGEWSHAGLIAASIAYAFFEPDPNIEWTHERRAAVRQALEHLAIDSV